MFRMTFLMTLLALVATVGLQQACCDDRPKEAPLRVTVKEIATFDHAGSCAVLLFSPDSEYLLSAGGDNNPELVKQQSHNGRVRMWNLAKRKQEAAPPTMRYSISGAALAADGRFLAVSTGGYLLGARGRPTLADPGTVALIDSTGKKKTAPLTGLSFAYNCLSFSPDGKTLAGGGSPQNRRGLNLNPGGVVTLWDVAKAKEVATLKGHKGYVQSLAFSPDGKLLASASRVPGVQEKAPWTGELKVWDVAKGKETASLSAQAREVWSVAFSPDGKLLASGGEDGVIRLWDVAKAKEVATLKGHTGGVYSLAFSAGGKVLASGGGSNDPASGEVKLWDVATRKEAKALDGHNVPVRWVTFDPTGKKLASGDGKGVTKVWAVDTGNR